MSMFFCLVCFVEKGKIKTALHICVISKFKKKVLILTVQEVNRAVLHGAPAVAKIGLVVVWLWGSVRRN